MSKAGSILWLNLSKQRGLDDIVAKHKQKCQESQEQKFVATGCPPILYGTRFNCLIIWYLCIENMVKICNRKNSIFLECKN